MTPQLHRIANPVNCDQTQHNKFFAKGKRSQSIGHGKQQVITAEKGKSNGCNVHTNMQQRTNTKYDHASTVDQRITARFKMFQEIKKEDQDR
jgi:hypothetical protein